MIRGLEASRAQWMVPHTCGEIGTLDPDHWVLVERTDFSESIRILILYFTKEDLRRDLG